MQKITRKISQQMKSGLRQVIKTIQVSCNEEINVNRTKQIIRVKVKYNEIK